MNPKEMLSIDSKLKETIDSEINEIENSQLKDIIYLEVVEKDPEVTKHVSWLLISQYLFTNENGIKFYALLY